MDDADPSKRARYNCKKREHPGHHFTLEKKPYLKRNRDIVAASIDGLIAAPRDFVEPANKRGKGTWTTVGYARKAGRRIWIVLPNGTLGERNGSLLFDKLKDEAAAGPPGEITHASSPNRSPIQDDDTCHVPSSKITSRVAPSGGGSEQSAWREVPQARFLSWSQALQLAYCAARDEDSALCADSDEWRQFYQERARSYREMMR